MKRKTLLRFSLALAVAAVPAIPSVVTGVAANSANQTIQAIESRGATTFASASSDEPATTPLSEEFPAAANGDPSGAAGGDQGKNGANRSHSDAHKGGPLAVPVVSSASVVAGATNVSFDALNHNKQRFHSSDGNNAFSLEPPDQGLCVGGSSVMEAVNDILQVYTKAGTTVGATQSLNHFFGYGPALNRSIPPGTPGRFGEFLSDPACLYDAQNQRWIVDVLALDTDSTTGKFLGGNHLDIAVSQTSDPTGAYNLYRIHTEDNGTLGQPDHHCTDGKVPNFCLGDYPHPGLDANGYYITTNEYPLFSNGFISAQIYAISRARLTSGTAVSVVHIDGLQAAGNPGFTVWPANSNPGDYETKADGTEYFLSSMAAEEANNTTGIDNRIAVWRLRHTASLDRAHPDLELSNDVVGTETYAVPGRSSQKAGDTPLRDCLNNNACATAFVLGAPDKFAPEPEGMLDSNDTRMQQVWFVGGTLVCALDTAAIVNGNEQAGIAFFGFDPKGDKAKLIGQGYLAVSGNNVNYPSIATLPNGQGVMAFTLVGSDCYPSSAYAPVSVMPDTPGSISVGDVNVASAGLGPQDGFTEYKAFTNRPRWGDYTAAAADGNTVWLGTEYIGQTCNEATWLATNFRCAETRTQLGNWGTRISQVTP